MFLQLLNVSSKSACEQFFSGGTLLSFGKGPFLSHGLGIYRTEAPCCVVLSSTGCRPFAAGICFCVLVPSSIPERKEQCRGALASADRALEHMFSLDAEVVLVACCSPLPTCCPTALRKPRGRPNRYSPPWVTAASASTAPHHTSRKSEFLSRFVEEVLQLTKMPSKRMAGNLMQAWQALANKPNAKSIPSFVVVVPQLLAAFASHSVVVSLVLFASCVVVVVVVVYCVFVSCVC